MPMEDSAPQEECQVFDLDSIRTLRQLMGAWSAFEEKMLQDGGVVTEENADAVAEWIDSMRGKEEEKLRGYRRRIEVYKSEVDAIKAEIDLLRGLRKSKERDIDALKNMVSVFVESRGEPVFNKDGEQTGYVVEYPTVRVSTGYAGGQLGVNIPDDIDYDAAEREVPDLVVRTPSINTSVARDYLKSERGASLAAMGFSLKERARRLFWGGRREQ